MEADWEIEIGGQAPEIDGHWAGFVDLRAFPEAAAQLPEAAVLPALADALERLNVVSSPVWTSKCDVWQPDSFDPDELDAPAEAGNSAVACYIDLLPGPQLEQLSPESAIEWCKRVCSRLHFCTLHCCRADLLIRRAHLARESRPGQLDLGITIYVTACGAGLADAAATLSSALAVLVDAIPGDDNP